MRSYVLACVHGRKRARVCSAAGAVCLSQTSSIFTNDMLWGRVSFGSLQRGTDAMWPGVVAACLTYRRHTACLTYRRHTAYLTYRRHTGCLTYRRHTACLTYRRHTSVSQGRTCFGHFTCCHTGTDFEDLTFYLTQSRDTDTGATNPSTDPLTPGPRQGTCWSANF